ncbi:MAG: hypothetical protein ABR503_02645 [Chitinophagaceae bacterium]
MDDRFNHLSQQIFNKPLEECNEQEIRSFIEQHPYFSPAQFLLLKKLDKDSEAYQAQYQKAILYYHDPVAFDFFLNAEEFGIDIQKEKIEQEQETNSKIQETKNENQETRNQEQSRPDDPRLNDSVGQAVPQETGRNEQDYEEDVQQEKIGLQPLSEKSPLPTEELSFEPFHTVDYFASVGIKLSQEEITNDRMGKQLKSFTDWLKTMKRLPVPELEKKLSGESEQKVEHMAADSLQNADIVTEPMAEVWIKQGNTQKAIEVYNKLSLHNPSKSPYFAAKIDRLKEQKT